MNGRDPVATILATLDAPVAPRPEFADALLTQLLDGLGHRGEQATRTRRARRPFVRLRPRMTPRLRLVLIVLTMVLLAATLAIAAYLGVRWISASPRGLQHSGDFRLSVVMRTRPTQLVWSQWTLGAGGRDIYFLRQSLGEPVPGGYPYRSTDLMRLASASEATAPVSPERLLGYADLADTSLWDSGVDLESAIIGPYPVGISGFGPHQTLAAADNGDLFLAVGAWSEADAREPAPRSPRRPPPPVEPVSPIDTSVIVRHADGRLERVLSMEQLGLRTPPGDIDMRIAASGPGRLWLMVWELRNGRIAPPVGPHSFFEVRDPDADGDWSDRTIRRLQMPESFPIDDRSPRGFQRTYLTEITTEPPLAGRPPSFLVASLDKKGRFGVHRITDRNDDGDAVDADEVQRLLDEMTGFDDFAPPVIAARVRDGRREVVVAGLTRNTRLSIVSDDGRVTDVVRAFDHPWGPPLAGPDGSLFVPDERPGSRGSRWIVYRLDPGRPAARSGSATRPAIPASEPSAADAPRTVPRLAFTVKSTDFKRGRIVSLPVDGKGGPEQLVAGKHNDGFCQSADGERMVYSSDEEAPNEQFLYVAGSDGSDPRKVTERPVGFWCGFSSRWLLLLGQGAAESRSLHRHDLTTGQEVKFADDVDRLAVSPDGASVVFVDGLRFSGDPTPRGSETLELLDMATLRRRRLAGPLSRRSFGTLSDGALRWSEDGSKVAYVLGPNPYPQPEWRRGRTPSRYTVRVQPVRGGSPRTAITVRGGPPTISLSPEGDRLIVCLPDRPNPSESHVGCGGSGMTLRDTPPSRLFVVDLSTGRRRAMARGRLHFAEWAPQGGRLAYATGKGVFLVDDPLRGAARRIAPRPRRGWPVGGWVGFSPDSRYIGLGNFSKRVAVLDVDTGAMRVVARETKGRFFFYRKWWR